MYTVSDDRPGGTSAGPPSREFPVLFHLMDVSRPRASQQSPAIDSVSLLNAVEQLRRSQADNSEPSPPVIPATEPVATTVEATVTVDNAPDAAQPAQIASAPVLSEGATSADLPSVTGSSDPIEAPSPSPTPPSLVSLRKKRKISASEDWFASHGKYIAVAFVLALVTTIYFARTNRDRTTVAKQEASPQPPLIDTTQAVAATTLPVENPAALAQAVQTGSAPATTSTPVVVSAPPLVEPSSDKPKDNLFEFAAAKNADERLAARPDDSSRSAGPVLTAPALTAPALTASSHPGAPEVASPPAHQSTAVVDTHAYPVTSSQAAQYPVSIPPAMAYPATSPTPSAAPALAPSGGNGYQPHSPYGPPAGPPVEYRSQYPVVPASSLPQQPAAPAWNAGQPASYPSYDTTARGLRNERTGSGTY